jgi:hypothetical protein
LFLVSHEESLLPRHEWAMQRDGMAGLVGLRGAPGLPRRL